MKSLTIAASRACPDCFTTQRELVDVRASDYIDVAAIVLAVSDITGGILEEIEATGFGIPVFVATHKKNSFRQTIYRAFMAYLSIQTPATTFMDASWKRQPRSTKPSCARRFSARLSTMLSRATARLTALGIRGASSSAAILPVISLSISLVRRFSAPICAMPTWRWGIC